MSVIFEVCDRSGRRHTTVDSDVSSCCSKSGDQNTLSKMTTRFNLPRSEYLLLMAVKNVLPELVIMEG